jgi:hypothetical protein
MSTQLEQEIQATARNIFLCRQVIVAHFRQYTSYFTKQFRESH